MIHCPNENDLVGLLTDRLPGDQRPLVEGHIETCTACQRQLDALTQSGDLKLADSDTDVERGPKFLAKIGEEYPETLLNGSAVATDTLRFPGPTSDAAPLGQLGDFDILEQLGSGSFGWVYRARERSLNRIVALKVLKPEMTARPDVLLRFEREARKASLAHDHIVSVYRFEKPAGFPPYIVMEFVDGETLDAKLKREGQLAPEEAASIARQVALGLAAAHEHGMVHRDIKPANILLDKKTGRAKISDFGLARDVADESMAVTQAGELAGTAPYMSPEHFLAPEKVDGRSDVFSLGVVLYQLLTGQLPFRGTFLQIRSSILDDEPTPPQSLSDAIPVDLETIVLACLQKDLHARYASAQAVAEDLRRYLAGEPILSRPTGSVERAVKWIQRKPAQAALVGVGTIAILMLASLIAGVWFTAELAEAKGKLESANTTLSVAKNDLQLTNASLVSAKTDLQDMNGKLVSEKAQVQRLKFVADMNLAHQAFQNDNFELLHQYLEAYKHSDLRGFEWRYLRWLADVDGRRLGPADRVQALAFAATGEYLALAVDTKAGKEVQIWTTNPQPSSVTNPTRGQLAFTVRVDVREISDLVLIHGKGQVAVASADDGISLWDFRNGQRLHVFDGYAPLALSHDAQQLAFMRMDGSIGRHDLVSRKEIGLPLMFDAGGVGGGSDKGKGKGSKLNEKPGRSKTDERGPRGGKFQDTGLTQLAFSPDGARLAAVGGHYAISGAIAVWDLKTGARASLEDAEQKDVVAGVAWSPDSQSLAAVGYDHMLRVWNAKTGMLRFRHVAHKLEVLSVSFDAAGELIATGGWDKNVKVWDARTGEEVGSFRGCRGIVTHVRFVPGRRDDLVCLDDLGVVRSWNARTEQTARVFRFDAPIHALAFGPSGAQLAIFGGGSGLRIVPTSNADSISHGTPALTPGSRGIFSADEAALFTSPVDHPYDLSTFAKGKATTTHQPWNVLKGIPVRGNRYWMASERIVLEKDQQFWVTPAHPSPESVTLTSFGPVPRVLPDRLTVDASGERLAFATFDRTIVVRRRGKGGQQFAEATLRLPRETQTVNALSFSPDGNLLAAGIGGATPQDYLVLLWDTRTRELRHQLTSHLCYVSCVAFSPDGKRLASGSEDWTVKIWDIDAGRATLTLGGHRGRIRDVAFSPDGNLLATASEDRTVRIWPGIVEAAQRRNERPIFGLGSMNR